REQSLRASHSRPSPRYDAAPCHPSTPRPYLRSRTIGPGAPANVCPSCRGKPCGSCPSCGGTGRLWTEWCRRAERPWIDPPAEVGSGRRKLAEAGELGRRPSRAMILRLLLGEVGSNAAAALKASRHFGVTVAVDLSSH